MYKSIIESISRVLYKFFDLRKTETQNQSETEIIHDKRDYKKATDIAEEIINTTEKYKNKMSFADRLRFSHLVEKFQKFN